MKKREKRCVVVVVVVSLPQAMATNIFSFLEQGRGKEKK